MIQLVLASENPHKIKEIQNALGDSLRVLSLKEAGFHGKLPAETAATYEGNALIKARTVAEATGQLSLGDDSGFEVSAMNDAPGVFSARFLGGADSKLQCQEILKRLKNAKDRSAKFVCVFALVNPKNGNEISFRGEVMGRVSETMRGAQGFGYDPIFIPEGFDKTFAELSQTEKAKISHRGKAVEKLKNYF